MLRSSFQIDIRHKIATIGAVGIVGLILVGGICPTATRSQHHYRTVAGDARDSAELASKLSIAMLEDRRDESNLKECDEPRLAVNLLLMRRHDEDFSSPARQGET